MSYTKVPHQTGDEPPVKDCDNSTPDSEADVEGGK